MRKVGKMITGHRYPKPVSVPSYDYLKDLPALWRLQGDEWETVYHSNIGQFEIDRAVVGDPNCFSYQRRVLNQEGMKRKIIVNTPLARNFPLVFDLINAEFEIWIWTKINSFVLCDEVGIKLDNIFPTTRINLLNTVEGDADQWLILDHFKLQELQKQALVVQQRVSIGDACNPSPMVFQMETKFDKQSIYPLYERNCHVDFIINHRQKDLSKASRNELALSDLLFIAPNEREAFLASLETSPQKHAFCIDIAIESDETLKVVMTVAEKLNLPFILVASTNESLVSYQEFFNNNLLASKVDELRFPEGITESISEVNIIECLEKFKNVRRLTYLHAFTKGVLDFLSSDQGRDFVRSLSSLITWSDEKWVTRIHEQLPELNSLFLLNRQKEVDVGHVQALLEKAINLTWLRFEGSISDGWFEFPKMKQLEEMTFLGCMDASVLHTLKSQTPNLKRLCLDTVTVSEETPSFEKLPRGLTVVKYLATRSSDMQEYYSILPLIIKNASTLVECVFFFHPGKNRYPDSVKRLLQSRIEKNLPPISFPVLRSLTLQKGALDDNTLEVFFRNGTAPPNLKRLDSDMMWSEESEWSSLCKQKEQRNRPKMTDWRLVTDYFSESDVEMLRNLSSSLKRLIFGISFDSPMDSECLWNEKDTQVLKKIAFPNLTQLTVIYRAMDLQRFPKTMI